MDPLLTVAVISGLVVLFGMALFFVSRTEDNFDQWYSAQRKMEEEGEKKKKKPGNTGKKATKKEKQEGKEDKKSFAIKNEEVNEEKEKVDHAKNDNKSNKEEITPLIDASNKQPRHQGIAKTAPWKQQIVTQSVQQKSENNKPKSKPAEREQPIKLNNISDDFTEVTNKKKRNSESEVKKVNVTTVLCEVKKSRRTLEEMDLGKLLTDMAAGITDNVHVQFLRNYLETQKKKENALSAASAASALEKEDLIKQVTDKTQEITRIKASVNQYHIERPGLLAAIEKSQSAEGKLRQELNQKTQEVAQLKSMEHQKLQSLHMTRQLVDETAKKLDETLRDLHFYKEKVKGMEEKISEAAKFEAATKEIHKNWQALKSTMVTTPTTSSCDAEFHQLEKEKLALQKKYEEERKNWEQKHQTLMDEYIAIQKLCNQLKEEVANFEKWKAELEKQEEKFISEKKEVHAIQAKLEEENVKLKRKIEELSKITISNPKLNGNSEEVVTLTKAIDLTSTPSDLLIEKKLIEENNRLQAKNDELRDRNLKLAEMIQLNAPTVNSNKSTDIKNDTKKDKKTKETASNKNPTQEKLSEDAAKAKTYRDALVTVKIQLTDAARLAEQQNQRIHELEEQLKNKASPVIQIVTSADQRKSSSETGSQKGAEEDWELV